MSTKTLWTAEMLEQLPDDSFRYEIDEGELIKMSPGNPTHGQVGAKIISRLGLFVEENDLGAVLALDPGFVLSRDPDTLRAPDVAFVLKERLAGLPQTGFPEIAPDLAIEVISPSETPRHIERKIQQYLDAGTTAVWLFYPYETRAVVRLRSGETRLFAENETIEEPDLLPGFSLRLAEIF